MVGVSTIGDANEVLREFLPRLNIRFAVEVENPETAYRPVPAELSLTGTVCSKHTRKVALDNTVKYHWGYCNCCREQAGPAMPVPGWMSWNESTAF